MTSSPARTTLRRCVAAVAAMGALALGGLSTLPAETAAAAGIATNTVVLTTGPTVASDPPVVEGRPRS